MVSSRIIGLFLVRLSVADEEDHVAFCCFFHFAHLAGCAAAIFLRVAADILRPLRAPLLLVPFSAESALLRFSS